MKPHGKVKNLVNITVKNIPEDLYEKLRRSAKINRRSINQEIIVCIEKSVQGKADTPEKLLEKARKLRKKTAGYPISNDQLNLIKGV